MNVSLTNSKPIYRIDTKQHKFQTVPPQSGPSTKKTDIVGWNGSCNKSQVSFTNTPSDRSEDKLNIPDRFTRDGRRRRADSFPIKIMKMLSCTKYENIIEWLPDGKSFKIVNPTLLKSQVLILYFKQNKISIFKHKLRKWGFKRRNDLEEKEEEHVFSHRFFQRGRFDLIENMSCKEHKPYHQSSAVQQHKEDDTSSSKAPPAGKNRESSMCSKTEDDHEDLPTEQPETNLDLLVAAASRVSAVAPDDTTEVASERRRICLRDDKKIATVDMKMTKPRGSRHLHTIDKSEVAPKRRRICSLRDMNTQDKTVSTVDNLHKNSLMQETTYMRSRLDALINTKKISSKARDEFVAPPSRLQSPSAPMFTQHDAFEMTSKRNQTQAGNILKSDSRLLEESLIKRRFELAQKNMKSRINSERRFELAQTELKNMKSRISSEQQMLSQIEYLVRKNQTRSIIINELMKQHHSLFVEPQQQQMPSTRFRC